MLADSSLTAGSVEREFYLQMSGKRDYKRYSLEGYTLINSR